MVFEAKIPEFAVYRLSSYLRSLSLFEIKGNSTITSLEIGEMTCTPDTQVRKDLAYFGQFGISGTGYDVRKLKSKISEILGASRIWNIVLVGVGSLGRALLAYPGFKKHGFNFVAALDNNKERIGKYYCDLMVQDGKCLEDIIEEEKIKIAIIAVPSDFAQHIADRLVKAGIICILNFAPVRLKVPRNIRLRNIDLAGELALFSYYLTNKSPER